MSNSVFYPLHCPDSLPPPSCLGQGLYSIIFFPDIFMWSDLKWIFISDFIIDTYRSIGVELRILLFWQIYSRSLQGWKLPLLRCSCLIRDVISPLKMFNLLLCLPLIFSVSSPQFFCDVSSFLFQTIFPNVCISSPLPFKVKVYFIA